MQFPEQVIEALKWVGIVFLAGFIGYFGRYLSMILIERFRRKKAEQPSETKTLQEQPFDIAADREKNKLKIEKKRIKAQKKADKKL